MNDVRLTRRGKAVIAIAIALFTLTIGVATSDTCWTGHGYGSCEQVRSHYNTKGSNS